MNRLLGRNLFFAFLVLLSAAACKSKKPMAGGLHPPVSPQIPLAEKVELCTPDSLKRFLENNNHEFKTFSAKVSVNSNFQGSSSSFGANLRIKKDSAIWISISPALGIEVARVLITPDSIKFLNRLNGTYFKGDYSYLNSVLQISGNFRMIQAILLGNLYLHYNVENYVCLIENGERILSTLKKRKIKKETDMEIPEILTQELFFSPQERRLLRMEFQDYRPLRRLSVQYTGFDPEGTQLPPSRVNLQAQAEKSVDIALEYSKMTFDKEVNLPFTIPENYEPLR